MFKFEKLKLGLVALVAAFSISGYASSAQAHGTKDIVIDSNGHHVLDSSGGCVRTKWDEMSDKCKKMDIMKMEERIIYFAFDSSKLDDTEMMKLDKLAKVLDENKITRVKIVGFTDRIGTNDYNNKLSTKRAHAVKGYLDGKVHLDKSPVELRALGESHPVVACKGTKGKEAIKCLAPNRRVEVEVDYYDMVR